jgi:hypothetical protein
MAHARPGQPGAEGQRFLGQTYANAVRRSFGKEGYLPPMREVDRAMLEALWECSRDVRDGARETRVHSESVQRRSKSLRAGLRRRRPGNPRPGSSASALNRRLADPFDERPPVEALEREPR